MRSLDVEDVLDGAASVVREGNSGGGEFGDI
jgi:hypothetical protein